MRRKEEVMEALRDAGMGMSMFEDFSPYVCDAEDSEVMVVPEEYLEEYRRDGFRVAEADERQRRVLEEYADEIGYVCSYGEWYEGWRV